MNLVVCGALGRMGNKVIAACDSQKSFNISALVDLNFDNQNEKQKYPLYKCFSSILDVDVPCDCIIDFSNHATIFDISKWCMNNNVPVVLATTGYNDEEIKTIEDLSRIVPVFLSGNMSFGISLVTKLIKEVAQNFPECDCEIVETHHNKKLDSPSGTALMFANSILDVKDSQSGTSIVCGRHGNAVRKQGEIGISSVRRGNVVGEHSVIFDAGSEVIEVKHTATDRALFAEGALRAANFLVGQTPGIWNMGDIFCK